MKSYLRYEPAETFGIIASPQSNIVYDFSGHLALTASVHDVAVWNVRQASQVKYISLLTLITFHII
jgi:U3 small nucleolar RNA-associated protein 12